MYNKTLGVPGYQSIVDKLQKIKSDPSTSQGEVQKINWKLHEAQRFLTIAKRDEYEKLNQVSVYGSDDYVRASAGELSFYLGYEVTKCPTKSHKTDDDCYQNNCEKRDWVFQVSKGDGVIFEMLREELKYPQADFLERELIVGIAHYIKSLNVNNHENN